MMLNMVQKLILGHRQCIMSRRELRETISKQNKEERALSTSRTREQTKQNILQSLYSLKPNPDNLTGILMPVHRSITTKQKASRARLTPVRRNIRFIQGSLQEGHTLVKEITSTVQRSLQSNIYGHKMDYKTKIEYLTSKA